FFWPGYPITSNGSDVTLKLDDELLAAKVEALRAHASQMKPFFDSYGDDFMRAVASTEHFQLSDHVARHARLSELGRRAALRSPSRSSRPTSHAPRDAVHGRLSSHSPG
ncbi:MAG: hypothetical protein ACRDKZ_00435, partial [Actinomycetota bacterium]